MFSIAENIYCGWQYMLNILSLIGGNVGTLINKLPTMTDYVIDMLLDFSAPQWIISTAIAFVSLTLLIKICHWGC